MKKQSTVSVPLTGGDYHIATGRAVTGGAALDCREAARDELAEYFGELISWAEAQQEPGLVARLRQLAEKGAAMVPQVKPGEIWVSLWGNPSVFGGPDRRKVIRGHEALGWLVGGELRLVTGQTLPVRLNPDKGKAEAIAEALERLG